REAATSKTFAKSASILPDSRTPATMKFAPNAPDVERRRPSRTFATYSGGAAPMPLTIPRPPASATAVAKAGEAILPIPACCNGTVHPSNSVNFVRSIVDCPVPVMGRLVHIRVASQPQGESDQTVGAEFEHPMAF